MTTKKKDTVRLYAYTVIYDATGPADIRFSRVKANAILSRRQYMSCVRYTIGPIVVVDLPMPKAKRKAGKK